MSDIAALVGHFVVPLAVLSENGRVYMQQEGARNASGEFAPGGFLRVNVRLITTPLTGEDRMILPEALREEEARRFFIQAADVEAIAPMKVGDALWHERRIYRAVRVNEWGGFRDVTAVLPFSGDIADALAQGAFSAAFGPGFDSVLQELVAA